MMQPPPGSNGADEQHAWGPLAGLEVLDIGSFVAAPFAARVLGDLGANVTRLEPSSGDPLLDADLGPGSAARCAYDDVNAGKQVERVVGLAEAVTARLDGADVLIGDLTPDDQQRTGLDLGALGAANPSLVIGLVTGYGQSGPDASRRWSELTTYHAGSEAATLPGPRIYERFPDRPPVRVGRYLAGYDAGLTLAAGVVAALIRRAATGEGDLIEVSAQEVEMSLNRTTISRGLNEGLEVDRRYEGYGWQGTLRCRDGWVCLRPNEDRHWRAFTAAFGRPELADDPRFATYDSRFDHGAELLAELERWTTTVDRSHVREVMAEAGVPGAPYLEPGEVLEDPVIADRGIFVDHPHGGSHPTLPLRQALASVPAPDTVERLRRRLADADRHAGPLAGLRVLDLTWVASGPYATLLLTLLGAEVIKVESPARPDLFRRSHGSDDDVDAGLRFVDLNQGKRSVALDLKDDDDRATFRALAASCDVLVENYRPGVRDRLGFGDRELWEQHPGLVTVSLSGFGATAADRHRPGYASVFAAESGISAMTGYPDAPPTDVRDSNDLRGGTATFLAAVAGVYDVLAGGRAGAIELGVRDVLIALQGDVFLQASRGAAATRSTNAVEGCPADGCYPASDGRFVAVSARTQAEQRALVEVIGSSPSSDADVEVALAGWIRATSASRAVAALVRAGVPAAATASVQDLGRDPHLAARRVFREGDHPRLGRLRFVGSPIRSWAADLPEHAVPSPLLGQHTDDILAELVASAALGPRGSAAGADREGNPS
jgi:crotonobetainyl-CoA:carnitine CoA-transferase CaiB-like acyl-CoA transferase